MPKQQLEIVQVQEAKGYAGGSKFLLPVMAKNLSLPEGDPMVGKGLKYTVFTQDLQDHIKGLEVGARFLADIEERPRPESDFGPDRNIVQIYVEGQPVSKKKPGGGGGGYRGRSLEEDLVLEGVKRRSIEGQTAMAQVGNALTCPTPIPGEDLGLEVEAWSRILGKYWQAVERSLDTFLSGTSGAGQTPPEARQTTQDANPGDQKGNKVSKPPPPPLAKAIEHVGDFMTRCSHLDPPISRAEVCTIFSVKDPAEIKDLNAAWKEILKKYPAAVASDKAAGQ